MSVKVAFIGAGNFANAVHYPSIAAIEDAELVAICDKDMQRLHSTADKYNISHRFTDYHEMLSKIAIDAVYVIMAPPAGMSDIVIDCLKAGKHVFMEKPPGSNLRDCQKMLAVAEATGRKTMVGFNRRFSKVAVEAKNIVGGRGRVDFCLAEFHKNLLGSSGSYLGMSEMVADVIHTADFIRWAIGDEPQEIYSYSDCLYESWRNSFQAVMKFRNGSVGILSANRASGIRYERFELHSKGIAAYIRAPEFAEIYKDNEPKPNILKGEELCNTNEWRITYGYQAESEHFIQCILEDKQPQCALQDAIKSMELIELIEDGFKGKRM